MGKKVRQRKAAPKKTDLGLQSVLQIVAFIAIGALGYHYLIGGEEASANSANGSGIVVIDTKRLLDGKIAEATQMIAQGADWTQEEQEMQGQIFGTILLRTVKKYRDQGLLVLDRRNALAVPEYLDITDQVAAEMGLAIEEFVDPLSAPVLSE